MGLKGQVAIVTGAGQGIGRTIALELAKGGADLALADINGNTAEKVREEVEEMKGEALAIRVDVSKWKDTEEMVRRVMEMFGRLDILVNNAGIMQRGKGGARLGVCDINGQDWDLVMGVNLKGVFNCSKAVIPVMVKRGQGKIINITSVAGLAGGTGTPSPAHYCVSKAGVICLTKALARELGAHHINVNALAPGRIVTEMAKSASSEINKELMEQTPLGRFGMPIDVARAVFFLVEESGDFITGETIVIDGGRTMH